MGDAAEFRRMAAQCKELAEQMSLRADRARLMEMALRWLSLAEMADRDDGASAIFGIPGRPIQVVQQQQQQPGQRFKDENDTE
jgi:hypothetical protein